jgi:antitoxin (DNA-binding transcriptional repressor) of toxin-antitoxin stability system
MATIRISAADAARDFAGLLAQVHAGAEVIIEDGTYPAAVLRSEVPAPRSLSECIELPRQHEEETGESPVSRRIGFMKGRGSIGPEFFDPLPEDELRRWNGEGE